MCFVFCVLIRIDGYGVIPESFMPTIESLWECCITCKRKKTNLTGLFFTIGNIVPGEKKGTYRPGKDELIGYDKGESSISVEDYADAMLNEVDKPQHHKERFTIGY